MTAVSVDSLPDCPVDAMACVGPLPEASNTSASSSYYGNSSTLSFLRTLQTTAFRATSTPSVHTPATTAGPPTRTQPAPPITCRFLPPRSTADYLVDIYFSHVSDLYTVLHEASFRQEYAKLWQPGVDSPPDPLWLCIMNCVLALACVFSDGNADAHRHGLDDGRQMAQKLYGQARTLCPLDQLDDDTFTRSGGGSGLPRVQALLLMGQYLQSTSDGNRCWTVFGLAIRLAQGMGLHLTEVNNHPRFSMLERELRKRCWCGCLVMDAVLAMTFGRPMMIGPEHYDSIDFPVDNSGDGSPGLLLFTHKLKLYQVLQRILRTFYQAKDQSKESQVPRCGDMAELDQQLQAWRAQLPASLKMDAVPMQNQNHENGRPRRILYARYLAVRIVLTRPSLAMVARSQTPSTSSNDPLHMPPLEQSFAQSAAETCIATAKHLLAHVHKYLVTAETPDRPTSTMQGAAWYNTHSVFSATLVLFSAHTIPRLQQLVIDGPHWADGMEVMRLLARRFTPAQACLSIMESFHQHLAQQTDMPRTDDMANNNNVVTGFLPTDLGPLPGDWLDFLGFDDAFGQDVRW